MTHVMQSKTNHSHGDRRAVIRGNQTDVWWWVKSSTRSLAGGHSSQADCPVRAAFRGPCVRSSALLTTMAGGAEEQIGIDAIRHDSVMTAAWACGRRCSISTTGWLLVRSIYTRCRLMADPRRQRAAITDTHPRDAYQEGKAQRRPHEAADGRQ